MSIVYKEEKQWSNSYPASLRTWGPYSYMVPLEDLKCSKHLFHRLFRCALKVCAVYVGRHYMHTADYAVAVVQGDARGIWGCSS